MEFLTYLLKVTVCTIVFYAVYQLFMSRLTFFRFNRFYLLASLVLSLTIPALSFTVTKEVEIPVSIQQVVTKSIIPSVKDNIIQNEEFHAADDIGIDWFKIIELSYAIIAACLLLLSIVKLYHLLKHLQKSDKKDNGLKIIVKNHGFTNCSFFNYVFVSEQAMDTEEFEVLVAHERVHAKQLHSLDKLLLLVAKAMLWFNPVIYLYHIALEQLHEYEADEIASSSYGTHNYADLLLRLSLPRSQASLVHHFVKSPIKKRIKMLFNHKTNTMKKVVYLLTLPALFMLICGFSLNFVAVSKDGKHSEGEVLHFLESEHSQLLVTKSADDSKISVNPITVAEHINQFFDRNVFNPSILGDLASPQISTDGVHTQNLFSLTEEKDFILIIDAGHGGKQSGPVINGVAEKDLTLEMAKRIKTIAEQNGMKVIMTRTDDRNISLTDRLKLINGKGNLLLSIHLNSMPTTAGNDRNGIEVYYPKDDTASEERIKQSVEVGGLIIKSLSNLTDITVKDELVEKRLLLMSRFSAPSLTLELGYMTNASDFKFVTNKDNQVQLASKIVEAVKMYKNSQQKTGLNVKGLKQNLAFKQMDSITEQISAERVIRGFIKENPKLKTISIYGKSVVLPKNTELIVDGLVINSTLLTYSDDDRKIIAKQATITDPKNQSVINGSGLEYDLISKKIEVTQAKGIVRKL